MAFEDNRPQIDRLQRQLKGADLTGVDPVTLEEILDASIADVEDKISGSFNGVLVSELYDGTGGNSLTLRHRPATSVRLVKVELPVLALNRVYTSEEVKLYRRQGYLTIFTYKLAAEQASLYLDSQIYGNLLPKLPQVATVTYTYGYPQFDPVRNVTTLDGGETEAPGDLRDPDERRWLTQLQQAAICDAAACVLAQIGGLETSVVSSVSFDGYSEQTNPQAYSAQVQALIERRDAVLNRRRRRFTAATIG